MINIEMLTQDDIGCWVTYTAADGHTEIGRLKSWNDIYIFVVYSANGNLDGDYWKDYTAAATRPDDLNTLPKAQKNSPEPFYEQTKSNL